MRLNKNTYPAFIMLEDDNLLGVDIDTMFDKMLKTKEQLHGFIRQLQYDFKLARDKFYITKPFREAISKASDKINEDLKHIKDIPNHNAIFFNDNGFTILRVTPDSEDRIAVVYGFTRTTLTSYAVLKKDLTYYGIGATVKDGEPYNDLEHLGKYINSMLTCLYFIHNCETEQKVVEPNKKVIAAGDKHFNESKSDVIILTCQWFTELIRNIPYGVTGHFRWQAHGERFSKRKLKWIADFQKSGYTTKAKKVEI